MKTTIVASGSPVNKKNAGSQEGQVIPFTGTPSVTSEEMTSAVQLWCFERDLSDALTAEEIGAMDMAKRMDAQRKALLIGCAIYLRRHPRSDVAMGVFIVQTLLSDNDRGLATISQPTLAKMFCRSVSSIADAQRRLKETGILGMTRGRYAGSYPIVPRAAVYQYNHLTWIVGALASTEKPINLPAPPDDCQSTGPTGGLGQSTGQTRGLKAVNHPVDGGSINRPDPMLFLKSNSLERKGEPPRQGAIAKVAGAMAATIVTAVLPVAAHPVDPPAQVQHDVAECWHTPKARMAAGTSVNEKRAQQQLWTTSTGLVEVAGAFRDELVEAFPLVDLKCGLAAAAPNVRTEHGAIASMQAIRRQFAFMQNDGSGKQKRAEMYKKPENNWL